MNNKENKETSRLTYHSPRGLFVYINLHESWIAILKLLAKTLEE